MATVVGITSFLAVISVMWTTWTWFGLVTWFRPVSAALCAATGIGLLLLPPTVGVWFLVLICFFFAIGQIGMFFFLRQAYAEHDEGKKLKRYRQTTKRRLR